MEVFGLALKWKFGFTLFGGNMVMQFQHMIILPAYFWTMLTKEPVTLMHNVDIFMHFPRETPSYRTICGTFAI